MSNIFKDIVGQEKPKKELGFYLDSYRQTRIMPHLMIVAPKGQGKTTMARATAKGLLQFDDEGNTISVPSKLDPNIMRLKKKPFVEVNCATLKNVKQFVNSFLIPYVQDKDVTVFFDEAGEIVRDVANALLTILNPNKENKTTFAMDEYVCDFDFSRQSFIFATNEVQKVNPALVDRLERITLEEYTLAQLGEIVQRGVPEVKFQDDILIDIAATLRGNARAAQKMVGKITAYLAGRLTFTREDWNTLRNILSIYPLGLNAIEIQILRHLAATTNGTSLTSLSAKTGMSREAIQKDIEIMLQKHALMRIETMGRVITIRGLAYLKDFDNDNLTVA